MDIVMAMYVFVLRVVDLVFVDHLTDLESMMQTTVVIVQQFQGKTQTCVPHEKLQTMRIQARLIHGIEVVVREQ